MKKKTSRINATQKLSVMQLLKPSSELWPAELAFLPLCRRVSSIMRETRLFDYAPLGEVGSFRSGDVAISTRDAHQGNHPRGRWAGLVDGITAWRVEEGRVLLFENSITRRGFRLNFSSPITCRPLLRTASSSDNTVVEALLSCFSGRNGCTLVQIQVKIPRHDPSLEPSYEEMSRQALTTTCITCMTEVDGDVVVGRADGSCGMVRIVSGPPCRITVIPFAAPPAVNIANRNRGEDTSMVSGASDESDGSRRSVASSISLGLMTRLFGSPRGATSGLRQSGEANSQIRPNALDSSSRGRVDKCSYKKTMDTVLDVARVQAEGKALMSLHESGRVCVYIWREAMYQYVTDGFLPVKLSVDAATHTLLTGPPESAIAVVMVDEDPNADSLRLFNVTAKFRQDRTVTTSFTQIAKREGPIDLIVSASFTGEDVIIATASGFLSGVLSVASDARDIAGLPTGTLWTAMDDVDKPFGVGRVLDEVHPHPRDQLLQAHRFSASSIAKLLRLDDPAVVTRALVSDAVQETVFEEDEGSMWNRLKARTEQITKSEDMSIRDMSFTDGVGIVVARQHSLHVLRALTPSEENAFSTRVHLLRQKHPMSMMEATILLSSHAACQVVASQYWAERDEVAKSKLRFMLALASSFSAVASGIPITDRFAAQYIAQESREGNQGLDLPSAISTMISTLEPGPKLLTFLHAAGETELLLLAAGQSVDKLPISSMFASGIAWLARFRERAAVTGRNPEQEHGVKSEDNEVHDSEMSFVSKARDNAYGHLLTAADWCRNGELVSEDDVECTVAISGLSGGEGIGTAEVATDAAILEGQGRLMGGPEGRAVKENLGFWLLERSVRLLESSGAPKSAAAAALQALSRAPDQQRHEMMRAAAFTRFLDAGDLENAMTAILGKPFQRTDRSAISPEEGSALRDAIGLFVNAVADRNMLQWLSERKLPEPLHVLCGMALERRARAADAMNAQYLLHSQRTLNESVVMGEIKYGEGGRELGEYEQLYSWHVLRGDDASAASAALEWGERLSSEGLSSIRGALVNQSHVSTELQVKLLLSWSKAKGDAWSYACTAVQLEPADRRYAVRSRFSLLVDPGNTKRGVACVSWISRRQLLAHVQSRCFTQMLSHGDEDGATKQRIQYLLSHDSPLLGEHNEGVRWALTTLLDLPTYDNVLLCAELATAWREEIGVAALVEVVRKAASLASKKALASFGYPELDVLLRAVVSMQRDVGSSRNWNLLALESALSTSAGAFKCPQWLVDAAAWGTPAFAEGTASSERHFAIRKSGDAAGVVRALLRNHRPVDAAKLLLVGLESNGETIKSGSRNGAFYVPYSAIDSTLEMLSQFVDEYEEAEMYKDLLAEHTTRHISAMKQLMGNAEKDSMEIEA